MNYLHKGANVNKLKKKFYKWKAKKQYFIW